MVFTAPDHHSFHPARDRNVAAFTRSPLITSVQPALVVDCLSRGLSAGIVFEHGAGAPSADLASMDDIVKLGYDTDFCRMMVHYFTCCEAGFATRQTEDVQS